MLHLPDALQLRYYNSRQRCPTSPSGCIYPMHCNYVATHLRRVRARMRCVASIRCTATTLLRLLGISTVEPQGLHLSDALQLRCYAILRILALTPSRVASIRCTSTTLLPTILIFCRACPRCIYPMHCNYVATLRHHGAISNGGMLHLSDALQLRCYDRRSFFSSTNNALHLSDALQLRCYANKTKL